MMTHLVEAQNIIRMNQNNMMEPEVNQVTEYELNNQDMFQDNKDPEIENLRRLEKEQEIITEI